MIRGRKRKVILEKIEKPSSDFYMRNIFLTPPPFFEPFRQNHFSLLLEGDNNEIIEPDKIRSYIIEDFADKSTISITAILMINDWVDKFKKMTIVKIIFIDSVGNINASFDYDIMYEGFSMGGSYDSDDVLMSTFKYKILE